MNRRHPYTRLSILTATLSTILPLIVFGFLLSRYLAGTAELSAFAHFVIVYGVIFLPIQFLAHAKSNEFASQLEQDRNATPTLSYRLVNSVFHGMLTALIGIAIGLFWLTLTM